MCMLQRVARQAMHVRHSRNAGYVTQNWGLWQADVRAPDGQPLRWRVSADVEALAWSPHAPTTFLVSAEDGLVSSYDARGGAGSAPLFRLSAHDAATCALSFNPAVPGLLATASTDAQVLCTACSPGGCPQEGVPAQQPPGACMHAAARRCVNLHRRKLVQQCMRGLLVDNQ